MGLNLILCQFSRDERWENVFYPCDEIFFLFWRGTISTLPTREQFPLSVMKQPNYFASADKFHLYNSISIRQSARSDESDIHGRRFRTGFPLHLKAELYDFGATITINWMLIYYSSTIALSFSHISNVIIKSRIQRNDKFAIMND